MNDSKNNLDYHQRYVMRNFQQDQIELHRREKIMRVSISNNINI